MNLLSLLRFIAGHPLNADARLAALSRFARWQFASRILPAPVALPFVNGTRLLTSNGMTGATANFYCGLHEVSEMAFVLHALRPEDLFADIGANVGSYTVLAAGAVGAQVVSVEPLPATFAKLADNIRLNDLSGRVSAHCCGVSSEPGELRFVSSLDTMNRVALPGEDLPTLAVPVVTLDELCAARCPTIIKMDVEGHELPALRGAGSLLANPALQAVLMETNQSGMKFGVSDEQLFEVMEKAGFQPCDYDPFGRQLNKQRSPQMNTIFVRDPDMLSAHCRAAPRFALVNGSI